MPNANPQHSNKPLTKRKLARRLIQQIVSLYDTIIEKIQHGIGLLWEQYLSQQLYNIAKLKVQQQLIQNLTQLQEWFENISQQIKAQFNMLTDNLVGHFDKILQKEMLSLNKELQNTVQFTSRQELKYQPDAEDKKENSSLYQTCTQSSRQQQKNNKLKKLCLACENHLTEAFGLCNKHELIHQKQGAFIYPYQKIQQTDQELISSKSQIDISGQTQNHHTSELRLKAQDSRKKRKQIQLQQRQQKEQLLQGSFYEVFFGLLEAFQM